MTHFSDGVRVGGFFPTFAEPGVPLVPLSVYDVVPAVLDADGIAVAQAVAAAGNLTLNGALVTAGVAVLDVPRAIQIVSSGAGDTTQTATVFGFDAYGQPMTETIAFNGVTPVLGQKAFKIVTRVAISALMAGNASCGTTDVLGLPYAVATRNRMLTAWDGSFVTTGTFVAADATNPATATTDDVRGTYTPPTATNGTRRLTVYIFVQTATQAAAYGVTQA